MVRPKKPSIRRSIIRRRQDSGTGARRALDIDEREQAEQALRDSEARFRQMADLLPTVICEVNPAGRFAYFNQAGFKTFGYTPRDLQRGLTFKRIVAPGDHQRAASAIQRILQGHRLGPAEYRMITKDGRELTIMGTAAPIVRQGQFVGLRASLVDITERKRVEVSLRESEQRFREITDMLPTIICEIDRNMRFEYLNEAGLKLFGYTPARLKRGLYVKDIMAPQDLARSNQRAGRVLKGEQLDPVEYRMRTKNGRERIIMANASPMFRDGQVVGLRASMVDITERKAIETSLKESEARLLAIFQSLHNSMLTLYDYDGRITFVVAPPEMSKRYGFEISSLTGRTPGSHMTPEDLRERLANIRDTFHTGRVNHFQTQFLMPRGAFDIDVTLSPLRSHDGKIVSVVGFLHDVTAEKQAAIQVSLANLKLESAREQERRHLAAELHDSVGQGLIALQLSAKNIITRDRQSMTDEQTDALALISERCGNIIREVRAICHGLYPPTLESLGLGASLQQLAMEPRDEMDVKVRLEVSDDKLQLKADQAIALFRIAQEAVSNAIRHSHAKALRIHLARRNDRLVLRVSDNGVGFDPAKTVAGIGLASMRQRMLALNGELKIASHPGRTVVEASLKINSHKPQATSQQARRALTADDGLGALPSG